MNEEYLIHYGVKGMKWGIRKKSYNPNASVRKSATTRTFERLASSGEKHARKQEALYNAFKNPDNLKSAKQWRAESESNRKAAKASYERDVFNKTASRKQKRDYKKRIREYNQKKSNLRSDKSFAAETSKKARALTNKYNSILEKEGLAGKDFDVIMQDPAKRDRYNSYIRQYQSELGKMYADTIVDRIGERPYYDIYRSED